MEIPLSRPAVWNMVSDYCQRMTVTSGLERASDPRLLDTEEVKLTEWKRRRFEGSKGRLRSGGAIRDTGVS